MVNSHPILRRSQGNYTGSQIDDLNQLAEAQRRLQLTLEDNLYRLHPIHDDPASAQQMSPGLRRQSVTLHRTNPFSWLPEMLASFSSRNVGPNTFFNDFLLRPGRIGPTEHASPLDTALFDMAAILADRRSHMLAQGLAQRTYTVFLPAAQIHEVAHPSHNYIILPVMSFIRLPSRNYFRRTFSLSLIVIPVSIHTGAPRSLTPHEHVSLQAGWTLIPKPSIALYSYPEGDLGSFLSRVSSPSGQSNRDAGPLREIIQDILFSVVRSADIPTRKMETTAHHDHLHDLVVRAVQVSLCGGCCSMMPDVSTSELKRWQANPTKEKDTETKLSEQIIRLLGHELTREWALAKPSEFRLRHGRGAEPLVPTFYFSFGLQRLFFTPSAADLESQNSSILWVVGWHLLLMTGISALLEMLGTFHHEMERRPTAVSAQAFLKEFLVDLEEYFDFELLPVYRLDFDALKRIEGIDNDFERLRDRVIALGQERIIDEGRAINQRLLWIAIGTFVVSAALLLKEFAPGSVAQQNNREPAISEVAPQSQSRSNVGTIGISSMPDNAEISVDGALVGDAPSLLQLPPGKHTIAVTLRGFKEWSKEVSVLPGAEVKLVVHLEMKGAVKTSNRPTP